MILSDADILKRLESGDLVIEPLDDLDLQIQPASVDLRLGQEFLEFQRANIPCIHPESEREVDEYVTETVVNDGDEFVLHPGDFVLGTTHERVEIPPDLIAHVEGRSSLGRLAVVVHASLPADEDVFLWTPEDGFGFYEIGAIVENERVAHAVSFDPKTLQVSTHPVTDYIQNPTQQIYRVTLESGRQVHVTKDHNLFTIDEHGGVTRIPSEEAVGTAVMVPDHLPGPRGEETALDLAALFQGDDEVIAYASDGFGAVRWSADGGHTTRRHDESEGGAPLSCISSPQLPDDATVAFKQSEAQLPRHLTLTPAFGWLLGCYIAGGSVSRTQIRISTTNAAFLDRVEAWFDQYDTSIDRRERNDGFEQVTVCSALWAKTFRALAGVGSDTNIPDRAWNWSDDILGALLEGLLDGTGCRGENRDTLSTANEQLADRVLYLASRLGRVSSVYSRDRADDSEPSDVTTEGTEWVVDIRTGTDARECEQDIPVPSSLLRSLRKQADMSMTAAATAMGYASKSSISNVENGDRKTVNRSTLDRFRHAYADAGVETTRLDQLLDGDVRFENVVAVEQTDRVEPTYDLEVQPRGQTIENFLGGRGGIFLSNTAGLCDPGYRGQITLELSNLGTAPVALTPGMRISQLTFTELTSPAERPYGADRGSKYQDQAGPQASRIQSDDEFGGDQLGRDSDSDQLQNQESDSTAE